MQISLFNEKDKRKSIIYVSPDKCAVSWLNPRRTRPKEYVAKLAERINRNGFEITRALWAYAENGHYEVFAGGTRLEAAQAAGIETLPIVLHEGYSEDELTRLADEDNENDEYHSPVSVVDVWMDYKRLADAGWTQQRIADAKGVNRAQVAMRLQYAEFPQSVVAAFVKNDFLKEGHVAEIRQLLNFNNLSPWRTFESVALLVIDDVLDKVRVKAPTALQFKQEVERQNAITELAQDLYTKLDDEWNPVFLSHLIKAKASSRPEVQSAYNAVVKAQLDEAKKKEDEARRQQSEAERQAREAEDRAALAAKQQALMAKVVLGDSVNTIDAAPNGIKLLLSDPPYGKAFQSSRRVGIAKADVLRNDDEGIFGIVETVLAKAYPKMQDNSTVFIFTDWRNEPRFRCVIESAGYEIKGSYIWLKPNHGTGDLEGTFAPKHERIIHAVKGNPKLIYRPADVLTGEKFLGTEHPTEKPIDLLSVLIKATTEEGDIVIDPFCGTGSTAIAAIQCERDFWVCDINESWHKSATEEVFSVVISN